MKTLKGINTLQEAIKKNNEENTTYRMQFYAIKGDNLRTYFHIEIWQPYFDIWEKDDVTLCDKWAKKFFGKYGYLCYDDVKEKIIYKIVTTETTQQKER